MKALFKKIDAVFAPFPKENENKFGMKTKKILDTDLSIQVVEKEGETKLGNISASKKFSMEGFNFLIGSTLKGNGEILGSYSIDNQKLLKGFKFAENFSINPKDIEKSNTKVFSTYNHKYFNFSHALGRNFSKDAIFSSNLSLIGKYSMFFGGLSASIDHEEWKNPIKNASLSFGGKLEYKDFIFAASLDKNCKSLSVGGNYHYDNFSVSAKYQQDIEENGRKNIKVGFSEKLDKDTTLRLSVDSDASAGVGLCKNLGDFSMNFGFGTNLKTNDSKMSFCFNLNA